MRHLRRHEEKDKIAGGTGLGRLISRRKLWRPETGYITGNSKLKVIKVADQQNQNREEKERQDSESKSEPHCKEKYGEVSLPQNIHIASQYPVSLNVANGENTNPQDNNLTNSEGQVHNTEDKEHENNHGGSGLEFFEDFIPDTGSSFNMPFTTLKDYSWMFESAPELFLQNNANDYQHVSPESIDSDKSVKERSPREVFNENHYTLDNSSLFDISDFQYNNDFKQFDGNHRLSLRNRKAQHSANLELDFLYLTDSIIPEIDRGTCFRVKTFILKIVEGKLERGLLEKNLKFLFPESMQRFFYLFFSNLNKDYPLIHAASFKPKEINSMLLVCILVLGASYSDQLDHKIAVKLHDLLRGVIFASEYFDSSPELWVLQSILLIEVFGRNRAGMKQMEMSHLFHGLLINLIRRSGYQSIVIGKIEHDMEDINEAWRKWIMLESMKRLVFLTFLWDVQHAVLYGQTLCMSAFELKLELPSDTRLWHADSPAKWMCFRNTESSPILFLEALKKYLNCASDLPDLNSFSRVLMLHGLMGVAWDMQRRDQTSLGFQSNPGIWKKQITKAYNTWKGDFDKFCSRSFSSCTRKFVQSIVKDYLMSFIASVNAIFHLAHITLWTNIVDLQIFAGSRHILGRNVSEAEYENSSRQFTRWMQNIGKPEKALFNAIEVLKEGLVNLDDFEYVDSFHYPWCIYISSLLCWGFYDITNFQRQDVLKVNNTEKLTSPFSFSQENKDANDYFDESDDTSMSTCVHVLASTTPGKYRSVKCDLKGLLTEVNKYMKKIRWGLAYESNKVVQGLLNYESSKID